MTNVEADTTSNAEPSQKTFFGGVTVAKIRIFSGLVLFSYVLVHFSTHALGLISLDVLQYGGSLGKSFWRFQPISILLYGSLFAHLATALWKVFKRRTLKMRSRDWLQLIVGISIPPLLTAHVIGTSYASWRYGINDTYPYVLMSTYVVAPFHGVLNASGLVAAWVHGCIGLHNWLDNKPFYTTNFRNAALIFAVLLPALSLTGYLSAAREVAILSGDGDWLGAYFENLKASSDDIWKWIASDTYWVRVLFVSILIALIAGRFIRNWLASLTSFISIDYFDGPQVRQPVGATLLEISREGGVGHANVCGGRGRCSTCRVRVLESEKKLPSPSELERKVLDRVNAPEDVRLACQLVPRGNMKVMRLLPSDVSTANAAQHEPWATGQERVVAVLFADLRDFTRTSEDRLPFDVVYLINQFSVAMGRSVESHDGRIDKFLGDGLMAIFGIDTDAEPAAKNALAAAHEMHIQLDSLNERLKSDLKEPLRMGIGIHMGPVVLGSMGYGASRGLTAIGDTVNTASRLESETKNQKCTLCISAVTAEYAGVRPDKTLSRSITVRGKREPFDIFALDRSMLEKLAIVGEIAHSENG